MVSAVAKDEKEIIYIALSGGYISAYNESNWFDINTGCLTSIKKIIVIYEELGEGLQKRTMLLYSDTGSVIKCETGNCGCRLDEGAFTNGSGGESDPFIISDVDDLKHIRYHAPQKFYYRLEDDITLPSQCIPIRDWEYPFNGKFDGNGHTISTLSVFFHSDCLDCGLF